MIMSNRRAASLTLESSPSTDGETRERRRVDKLRSESDAAVRAYLEAKTKGEAGAKAKAKEVAGAKRALYDTAKKQYAELFGREWDAEPMQVDELPKGGGERTLKGASPEPSKEIERPKEIANEGEERGEAKTAEVPKPKAGKAFFVPMGGNANEGLNALFTGPPSDLMRRPRSFTPLSEDGDAEGEEDPKPKGEMKAKEAKGE